jgi:hypothetical protein
MPRRNKAMTNEISHPYVVQLAVVGDELDIELSRRIMQFHNSDIFSRDMDEELLRSEAKSITVGAFPIY